MLMMMTRFFVEINVELVLNDWCYIRMMWNVVWQSPFQIVTTFFYSVKWRRNFSYLIHSDKIGQNRDFVRKILIASTAIISLSHRIISQIMKY